MIDRDLAELYQVETKVLNQAVKRNIERFPDSFRFQLDEEDLNEDRFSHLRSQSVTSSSRSQIVTLNKHGGRRYLPHVFTEQGVAMLSAVLKSDVAVRVSVQIIHAFVEMRKVLATHSGLLQRMEGVERKLLDSDRKFEQLFKALESKDRIPNQGVFFDGQVFDAYELASKIIRSAKQRIVLIDNYIDESTLTHLSKKNSGVNTLLLSQNASKPLILDVQKANAQYGGFELKSFSLSHDRFLIIDDTQVYHLGASLKDLGKKWFAFSKLDAQSVDSLMNQILKLNQLPPPSSVSVAQ
jgi:hypothetical protein